MTNTLPPELTEHPPQPVAPAIDPEAVAFLQWLFAFDELHIRQRVLTLAEKYTVQDQFGYPRFFVVRPPKLAINIALRVVIFALRLVVLYLSFRLIFGQLEVLRGLLLLIGSNFVLTLLTALLAPYRDVEVYTDEAQTWRILTITQDTKIALYSRYTLWDCLGNEVAVFRRDTLRSIFRREWLVETPQGDFLFRCREDSVIRALLRRYLGTMYGLLRTNFNFEDADGVPFGVYDRKFSIIDEYVLNLHGDPQRFMDRRVCLAMAILLDTGESR